MDNNIKEMKTCPHCQKDTLVFSQNADISYKLNNDGTISPILEIDKIGWMDSTSLYCTNCYANCDDSDELSKLKHNYDNLA